MRRSQRLQVVLQLYQRREDEMSGVVQAAQLQLQTQESQLHQLVTYQRSYQDATVADSGGGQSMSIAQWRRLQDYIDQLSDIIAQQEQQVGLAKAEVERAEVKWQQAHLERRSMESAIDRISREEQVLADRQEQKALDEMIQQMRGRRR